MLILSLHGKPAQVAADLSTASQNIGNIPLSELAGMKEENMKPLVVSMPCDSATAWHKAIYHVDPCARYRLDELVACPHEREEFLFVHPEDANLAAWYEGGRLYMSV